MYAAKITIDVVTKERLEWQGYVPHYNSDEKTRKILMLL